MARIQKLVAQQGLNPGSAPDTPVGNYVGSALENLGGSIQSVAAAMQERNEKRENFRDEMAYRSMNTRLGAQYNERLENIAPDGAGFHDDFYNNVFRAERDQFLSGVSPRNRERFEALLADPGPNGEGGPDALTWSTKAAEGERDQTYKWYSDSLSQSQEQLANAIALDPDGYDEMLNYGIAEIEASGLPRAQQEEQKRAWERMAQVAYLNRMLETNPEQVIKDLGGDARYLSPTTQYAALRNALIQQESGGRSDAVSPKGAIGLMQIMPGTGHDIAKEIGDANFPVGGDIARITEYLSRPSVNQRYGDFYLQKQIRDFGREHGLEAALIAYNGGPGRARAWIESGYNDSVIPAETRNYYKAIMARLPGMQSTRLSENVAGDPSSVRIEFTDRAISQANRHGSRAGVEGVSPDLVGRVQTAFASVGIDRVRISSGHRNAEHNKAAGGAEASQHVHGTAMDIDVSGYSNAERVNIIRALSNAGITGIGVGANIIHADTGGRRAWGYARSSGGGAVPGWAREVVDEHLRGPANPPSSRTGLSGRFATLPYSDRQTMIANADRAVTQRLNANTRENQVARVEARQQWRNEIAAIETSGQSTGLDETVIATVLGEDDYVKFVAERDRARRTFNATDGIATMSQEDMDTRIEMYDPVPGSPTYSDDLAVQAAVRSAVDRAVRERSTSPDRAAMRFDDVQQAWQEINATDEPPAASVQDFVRLMLERQKEFNLRPGSERPVPREWAMEIGRSLGRIPEIAAGNVQDVNAAITLQYQALEQVFGEFTEEVILYALQEYNGVGPNTAELIEGYMNAIQAGGDPLRLNADRRTQAEDMDDVEAVTERGWFGRTWDRTAEFFAGEEDPRAPGAAPEAPAGETGYSPEAVRRAIDLLQDASPADEAALVRRFGADVVDAARRQLGRDFGGASP